MVAARDMPIRLGDMDNSLYLLFREIRRHSTVALSGESADEVFGGYRWFHDAETRWADNFPWINSLGVGHWARSPLLRPELAESLDVESYVADSYRSALRDVPRLDSENGVEARMRELCYPHLSRFVQYLLDRKDRTSMATGLEVRVPFCDHRLVEYVFNTPWSLKTFDSKEKSLLRSATADLLPDWVAQRTKSPYPSTQDDLYVGELQRQTGDVLADPNDRVNDLINGDWFRPMTNVATTEITTPARNDMERLLDLSVWLKQHSPELKFH
ncbi:Asparagine synthase [Actinopolyspora lacussalsi subsp. righensis]|uniref:asparagine synthase (glutamine-hydrolyzing) n=1 Tax=Actinopolyspora righensis TaxID=995060 RepID=A0A1I7AV65_9ACTN|nr:asparagine synthase C-terminal domain-containing protein [Actinopolyspora righensis]SFT78798.1 Asparagine synthase [Actinopolyspora righensis]